MKFENTTKFLRGDCHLPSLEPLLRKADELIVIFATMSKKVKTWQQH